MRLWEFPQAHLFVLKTAIDPPVHCIFRLAISISAPNLR
jgi:hypothetical protein